MDTKVIAMVGAVIVIGAAVYGVATGTVLPSVEEITEEEPSNTDETTEEESDTEDSGGSDDEDGNEGEETEGDGTNGDRKEDQAVANETGTEEVAEQQPELPIVCEERGGNVRRGEVGDVNSAAGPVFDPILFESMLHDNLNKLRSIRSDAESLRCDPELRELAREHSELYLLKNGNGDQFARSSRSVMRDRIHSLGGRLQHNRGVVRQNSIRINSAESRYEGVCENPRERTGRWLYQRDTRSARSGDVSVRGADKPSDQRMAFIRDHDDLVRDVRGSWGSDDKFINKMTRKGVTRQGVGVYMDRKTGEVVVTHVVC